MKLVLSSLLLILCCCSYGQKEKSVSLRARKYIDSAITIFQDGDTNSYPKAILYLNNAIAIDSNSYPAYYNKLEIQTLLKQYDSAVITWKSLKRFNINNFDYYIHGGMLYYKIGDITVSKNYFEKSLSICNQLLDTLNANSQNYSLILIDKGSDLVMLDRKNEANVIFKKLANRQSDADIKNYFLSFINMDKDDIFNEAFTQYTGSGTSVAK